MISNLREQMAGYHALLDKLEVIEARNATLERHYNERESHIKALEQELTDLKRSSTSTQYETTSNKDNTQCSLQQLNSVVQLPIFQHSDEPLKQDMFKYCD